MEIFLENLPPRCNEQRLRNQLRDSLKELGIGAFDVLVFRNGGRGTLTVPTEVLGNRILKKYGALNSRHATQNALLRIGGKVIRLSRSRKTPDRHSLKGLYESHQKILQEEAKPQTAPIARERKFDVNGLECGVWEIMETKAPVFNSYYKLERNGQMIFGRDGVRVMFFDTTDTPLDPFDTGEPRIREMIFFPYYSMRPITVSIHGQPHVTFTLNNAPRFYYNKPVGLMEALSLMDTQQDTPKNLRSRTSSIDQGHSVFAAFCFVYRFHLRSDHAVRNLLRLGQHKGVPAIEPTNTNYTYGYAKFIDSFVKIIEYIRVEYEFSVAFQLTALFANGDLPPDVMLQLLPDVMRLVAAFGNEDTAAIIQDFHNHYLHRQDPLNRQTAFSGGRLQSDLVECARKFARQKAHNFGLREALEDDGKLAFIHHAMITPAGCYFYGPKAETQNRVLRTYTDSHDYFLRVTFAEENGDNFAYERDVNQDHIYARFRDYMIKTAGGEGGRLIIGDRVFSFLGFSGASLRNHTCWFMAPFYHKGELIDAPTLISKLGDFSHITTPGKCAARIGQAFSNTFKSIHVPTSSEIRINDVERNGRCFSDGCGTISLDMMERIWKQSPSIARSRPFVFQIRFAGMWSLIT